MASEPSPQVPQASSERRSDPHHFRRGHYFGPHGIEASKLLYDRLSAEYAERRVPPAGRMAPASSEPEEAAVRRILAAYGKSYWTYYIKNGQPTNEVDAMRLVIGDVKKLYGTLPASRFGPKALKAIRQCIKPSPRSVASPNDFGFDPHAVTSDGLRNYLDRRCSPALDEFLSGEPWKQLVDSDVEPEFVREAMEEIHLETAMSRIEINKAWNSITDGEDVQANTAIFDTLETASDWSYDQQLLFTSDYRELGASHATSFGVS